MKINLDKPLAKSMAASHNPVEFMTRISCYELSDSTYADWHAQVELE